MVKWDDPDVIASCGFIFEQLAVFLTGFYGWEFLLTFYFDWYLVSGRTTFRWPHFFYLLGRYCMLFALVSLVVISRIAIPMNCGVLLPFITVVGLVASACATTNLMIRTIIIWGYKQYVMFPLCVATTGHFLFLMFVGAANTSSHWDPESRTCRMVYKNDVVLAGAFLYTVVYDFLILALTITGVLKFGSDYQAVWSNLSRQGLVYFFITSMVNIPALIFAWLDLNEPMKAMFSPPASTISIMMSSRAVVHLAKLNIHSDMSVQTGPLTATKQTTRIVGQLTTHVAFPSEVYARSSGEVISSRDDINRRISKIETLNIT